MKKFILLLACASMVCRLPAETLTNKFAKYGELFVVKLDSAPLPHPDRAQGHKYHEEFYSAKTNYSDNSVAFFVPKGFRPGEKTDYVIHFHGWRHHISTTLDEYQLVEQFSQSGRNAILIVPQGPYDAPDSFGGKLEDANGFSRFMWDVTQTLQSRGIIKSATLGDIILSGHSGGYQVISSIVTKGGLFGNVREVWLFDALYARDEQYMKWFNDFNGHRLIDIYTLHGGTKDLTEQLMKKLQTAKPPAPFLSKNEGDVTAADLAGHRLIFIYSPLQHNEVVFKNGQFREYLKTSLLEPLRKFSSPKTSGE